VRDRPLGTEALLELHELARNVGDGGVDLARDEVTRPQRLEGRVETAVPGDQLAHQ
jgi:hypothetical protein